MSYGVRGMEKKLLFSNRYEKDMDLFDDLPDDMPELPSFLKIHSHRIMAMYLTDSFPNRS
jgi:hypothetical protein